MVPKYHIMPIAMLVAAFDPSPPMTAVPKLDPDSHNAPTFFTGSLLFDGCDDDSNHVSTKYNPLTLIPCDGREIGRITMTSRLLICMGVFPDPGRRILPHTRLRGPLLPVS